VINNRRKPVRQHRMKGRGVSLNGKGVPKKRKTKEKQGRGESPRLCLVNLRRADPTKAEIEKKRVNTGRKERSIGRGDPENHTESRRFKVVIEEKRRGKKRPARDTGKG